MPQVWIAALLSLRGGTTKQSRNEASGLSRSQDAAGLDCRASLAKTGDGLPRNLIAAGRSPRDDDSIQSIQQARQRERGLSPARNGHIGCDPRPFPTSYPISIFQPSFARAATWGRPYNGYFPSTVYEFPISNFQLLSSRANNARTERSHRMRSETVPY